MRVYLADRRDELGYSQRKVARMSNVSYQYYSQFENGHRGKHVSLRIAAKIARSLELTLEEFYVLENKYIEGVELTNEKRIYKLWFISY